MGVPETGRIVRDMAGGDRERLAVLLERIRPRVVLWAATHLTRSLRAKEDPEDLAQRILFKAYERIDSFEGRDEPAFFRWLWQIGRHEIIDLHRYYAAEKRRRDEMDARESALPLVPAEISTPSTRLRRTELLALIRQAVERLPEEMRDVFRLCKLEGLAPAEAAAEMGRSANAVRVLLCRTLARIRQILGDLGVSIDRSVA
jgi:RNA polymerase sigma-70 factor (ECF subfamily)